MVKLNYIAPGALALLAVPLSQFSLAAPDSLWQPQIKDETAGYARVIQLEHAGDANNNLLGTFEHWINETNTRGSFIIRESKNQGTTWETLANISDANGRHYKFFYQPFLFEFPRQLGKYPAGTLLLVGNLHDGNHTDFFSWRSNDHGHTWDTIGMWQTAFSKTGHTDPLGNSSSGGIWEPFLFLDKQDRLVAIFSDERNYTSHSQMLVHVTSDDGGDSWTKPIPDMVGPAWSDRPGMATVAKMDNGEYFLSYEWCDKRWYPKYAHPCRVHAKTSSDGISWNPSDKGILVTSPDNVQASGSPYSLWDPVGKQLIVSSKTQKWYAPESYEGNTDPTPEDHHVVHVNKNLGKGNWSWASAPWYVPSKLGGCGSNYSPNLLSLLNGTILYSTNTPAPDNYCGESTGASSIATLPYQSNFSTTGNAGWIEFDNLWSISKNEYSFGPVSTPATIAITGFSGWKAYKINTDVLIKSKSGVAGVVLRASNSKDASNKLTRYTAVIDSGKGSLAIYRVSETDSTALKSVSVTGGIQTNQNYHLSFSAQGENLVVTLVDKKGVKSSCNATDGSLLQGAAGLYGSYGSGSFSNVEILKME